MTKMTVVEFKDSGGAIDMVVAAATKFFVTGPLKIHRVNVLVVDETGNGTWDTFGNLNTLANGIQIEHLDSKGATRTLFTPTNIKRNIDWCRLAGNDGWSPGVAATQYCVRWSLFKHGGPLVLTKDEKLQIWIKDALTGLDLMEAVAEGTDLSV